MRMTTPQIHRLPSWLSHSLLRRGRLAWTLGNLLMFAGLYLLLYVGGLYAQIEYQRLAARGDNSLQAPRAILGGADHPRVVSPVPAGEAVSTFRVPVLNAAEPGMIAEPALASLSPHTSTVERLVIPSVGIDSKVIEVGWITERVNGADVAVWEVAEYAVGQHRGSANPGEGGNIVLAGHVGGYGKVFADLFYVKPGDQVVISSAGRQFLYVVSARLVVDEEGVPAAQQARNAQLIAPTDQEVVTLVTCWPPSGPDRYKQRVIVRAVPYSANPLDAAGVAPQSIR